MSLKNCLKNEYAIILKTQNDIKWETDIKCITTPMTVTFAVSAQDPGQEIKKITWDFGTGNMQKSFTNRKQDLNLFGVDCKYKKSHDTTITIQASVYTDQDVFCLNPINTITINPILKAHYVEPEVFKEQILTYYKTNIFTNEVAESIYKIANRLAFAGNFINYCVDEETEALTKRGWLKYNEITTDDIILSYDIDSKRMKWSSIKEVYKNEYDGYMHKLTNQGMDALVTPGHKFVTKERGLVVVENIKAKEHIVLMGKPVISDNPQIYTDDFVELVGWAVTEGNYIIGKKTHAVQIFQKIGPKADQIRNCLKNLNIKFKEYKWTNPEILGFRFNKKYANDIIALAPKKVLSMEFILSLSQKQRLILIDTMLKGDGWIVNRPGRSSTFGYIQKDKNHVDSFLALCTISGITTSHNKVINDTPFGHSECYQIYFYNNPKHSCSVEHANFYGGKPKPGGDLSKGKKKNKPTQQYKGIVWCPRTEYGTFICRRGNYIYITGNTYREEMVGDAVIRMIEALTQQKFDPEKGNPFSYFTKIAFHAFCNRIKKEKKMRQALTDYQNEIYNGMASDGHMPYKHHNNHNADEHGDNFNYENI
ncbi:MAG: hypothetical protein WC905_00860 [Patescibacteria group bacterium]|jgi:hypothetical protein